MNTEIHQIIRRRLVTKQNILVPMYKIKDLNSLVRRFLHFISLKKNYTLFFIIFWGFFYKKQNCGKRRFLVVAHRLPGALAVLQEKKKDKTENTNLPPNPLEKKYLPPDPLGSNAVI
jgi:hypothetical protein